MSEPRQRIRVFTELDLPDALTVLFVGLKLTGYTDWSWFQCFLPVLASLVVGVVYGAIVVAAEAKR